MNKVLLLLFALFSANATAAINKWVDQSGQVHYSDQPPPANAKKAQTLPPVVTPEAAPPEKSGEIPATKAGEAPAKAGEAPAKPGEAPAATAPAAPKTPADREAELKKAKQAKEEAAKKAAQEQAVAEANKANCESAQRNLRTLQAGGRIAEIDANGQRYYLTEQDRQQRITKAQQDIATYCK